MPLQDCSVVCGKGDSLALPSDWVLATSWYLARSQADLRDEKKKKIENKPAGLFPLSPPISLFE